MSSALDFAEMYAELKAAKRNNKALPQSDVVGGVTSPAKNAVSISDTSHQDDHDQGQSTQKEVYLHDVDGDLFDTTDPQTFPRSLLGHKVDAAPDTLFYVPGYLSETEEEALMKDIYSQPSSRWELLKARRLQNWGGTPKSSGMDIETLPAWLEALGERLVREQVFPVHPNHVLINEYSSGQGIMPHEDGPLYVPLVAIISLSSPLLFQIQPHRNPAKRLPCSEDASDVDRRDLCSLLLEPRSLFIMRDDVYRHCLHSIDANTIDVQRLDKVVNMHQADFFRKSNDRGLLDGSYNTSIRIRRCSQCIDKAVTLPTCSECRLVVTRRTRLSLTIRIVKKVVR
eukprot:TRINITY_DN7216_c0_g1_i1.p1 TRINITY_DN7216_c0_g1~~TRINITY_DN7216_c0_g1_i1.p1  ORF type:complete len:341 (-),score=31.74 TRINITY_DN7216_c0_g1_i1:85-1107(-)